MQISDGNKWSYLACYDEPKTLGGKFEIDVVYDQTMTAFQVASSASLAGSMVLIRLSDDEMGLPFLVEMSDTPVLIPHRVMTVQAVLTPIGAP